MSCAKYAVLKYAVLVLCLLMGAISIAAHVNDRGMDYQRYKDRLALQVVRSRFEVHTAAASCGLDRMKPSRDLECCAYRAG